MFIFVGMRIPPNNITEWIAGILVLVGVAVALISFTPLSRTVEYLKTIKHIMAESSTSVDGLMRHEPLELYTDMMAYYFSTNGGGDSNKDIYDKWIKIGSAITASNRPMLLSASKGVSDWLLMQIADGNGKNAICRFLLFLAFVGALDEHVMNEIMMQLAENGCTVLRKDEATEMEIVRCMKYFPESSGKKAVVLNLRKL